MKKWGLLAVMLAAGVAGSAFAWDSFATGSGTAYGGWHGGHHNGGGFNHGHAPILPDPKNPASVRDWSKPQAQSVYCVGAGCHLTYPTPQQQRYTHGNIVCNNSGCHAW